MNNDNRFDDSLGDSAIGGSPNIIPQESALDANASAPVMK